MIGGEAGCRGIVRVGRDRYRRCCILLIGSGIAGMTIEPLTGISDGDVKGGKNYSSSESGEET